MVSGGTYSKVACSFEYSFLLTDFSQYRISVFAETFARELKNGQKTNGDGDGGKDGDDGDDDCDNDGDDDGDNNENETMC